MDLSSASPLASYALAKVESFLEGLAEVQSISPAQLIGEVGHCSRTAPAPARKLRHPTVALVKLRMRLKRESSPPHSAKRAYRARARKGKQAVTARDQVGIWPTPELRAKEMEAATGSCARQS